MGYIKLKKKKSTELYQTDDCVSKQGGGESSLK